MDGYSFTYIGSMGAGNNPEVVLALKALQKAGIARGICISRAGIFGMNSGWQEHRDASGGYGIRIRSQAFALSRRCAEFSVIRRRA